jgi:catalase
MAPAQQQALFDNTARAISGAPREIQLRHIRNCMKADRAYGEGIARVLKIPASEIE